MNPCQRLGHCRVCVEGRQMICCECGDALVPWHPDIQHFYVSGQMT